jgi:hypothetical protein
MSRVATFLSSDGVYGFYIYAAMLFFEVAWWAAR